MTAFDFDVVVVGSGFGGSVAALRLVEKGYRVAVLEAGRRFADHELPKTSWRLRDFLWAPALGMFGIQRIHVLRDVVVLAGAGVGGGSLNYANTLYRPEDGFFNDPQWSSITDWADELAPYYDQASRMLGVVENPSMTPADEAMKTVAEGMGVGDTFRLTPVGVYFGEGPGIVSADPFFGGVGPSRTGCTQCGECMTGCRHNAKNTLPKNYLALAEEAGVKILPLSTVTGIDPIDDGYAVEVTATGSLPRRRRILRGHDVVLAAGAYNTQKLLHAMKDSGRLPELSPRLGAMSRTNSEALMGAVLRTAEEDFSRGVAITSSFHPDPQTHVEPVRYGHGSNSMGLMQSLLTTPRHGEESWRTFIRDLVDRPAVALSLLNVRRWSERSIIALVMQTVDNSVTVVPKRTRFRRSITSRQDASPVPTHIPVAHEVVERIAAHIGGIAAGSVFEHLDKALTAHFVGGCVIGASAETGVVDAYHRVYGNPGLHVVDGSTITANLGVNPSLTITAQAERALAMWPNKGASDSRPQLGAAYERVAPTAPINPVVPESAPGALRLPIVVAK